ncbi:MAG: hypothetical protein HYW47_01035 [Deltaproteobacteria bacterium]|nr:hypothetical protein [Deltaproteobacteria bacterium]
MKKPILILLSLSLAVLFSIQEGRPAPKITNTQTIPFETNPFDLMEEDLILLGLPLESVSQEEKAHIIQNIEETVAHYSGENRTQLKMAAADALASVITNDDSIAGVGLVSRATGAAYNLNTHTPTLQKALWKVHFLENNRIDEQVMHHGQEIEDMAGLRFPAGKKPRPWHQALLSHQNSARALLIGLQNPDVHRAFDSVALLSPRTQEPTEEETEILNSLVMNQNLPPTVRTDAIETALRYRHQFKKNLKTENDHIRLSFVDDTLAQGFDQNIRYHDESQVFGHGVSALSEIEDYNTLGEALNFRMQKRNWEEDVRVPEEEFEVYKSSLKYFLDGTHNESTKEDVLNHLPHLINTILHKDPVALTARARLSQLLDNIKKTMQSLSPEERLYVADQTKLPEAASEWLKEKYKIFLDDLDLQKIGVCNEKADGKIVLKKQKSLKEDVEKIDQLSEKIQEKKALTDPHICLVSTYKLNDTDQLVLDRLLKLRAQRMKSLAIAYHALKSQGSEVEVPPLCKSEFHPFFDDEKNENTQSAWLTTRGKEKGISQEDMDTVNEARNNAKKTNKMSEEEWHKTLNKAIQDSYALADIQDDIRYFSEGGLHWRYGTEQGLLISEERRSQPHWVGYARPGVGEFPTSALFKDQARDSYYAPHLNQGRNLYEELHEKIKQNRAQYDALLVQTGGLAAGLVQEGVPFHDFVYKEVHLEDALLETTNHSDDYLKQFENLEDFPQSLWKPFWKNIFGDLKIPISSATTYSSPGNKENRGWNHHQERTIVDYPKLIGHLQHEIENMNLRVQDPHEWTQDGLKDRELATKYDRYKKALELIQKRYEEKMDTFKKEKGLELLKQARNYNDKKLNSYLEELCLDGHYGTDSEKIEKLRYLALDEKLRKEN